ncbi:MAG: DUF4956 domain-containing protein [Anaerolineales bacterium]|nr:DUF4956 domain-containing protein [Anaerolineales bacterium]
MDLTNPAPLSLLSFTINLLLDLLLSVILAWYYKHLGESLSNRSKFAPILPVLSLITLVVISIVKSSLALSLGLVGALSIVRFRTAIKDPEELIFLFFAIAIGLGMGADQRIPTMIAFAIIMGFLLIRKYLQGKLINSPDKSLFLNINSPVLDNSDIYLKSINEILKDNIKDIDLRRFDISDQGVNLVYYVNSDDPDTVGSFVKEIRDKYSGTTISIVEQNNLLGG